MQERRRRRGERIVGEHRRARDPQRLSRGRGQTDSQMKVVEREKDSCKERTAGKKLGGGLPTNVVIQTVRPRHRKRGTNHERTGKREIQTQRGRLQDVSRQTSGHRQQRGVEIMEKEERSIGAVRRLSDRRGQTDIGKQVMGREIKARRER